MQYFTVPFPIANLLTSMMFRHQHI